MFWSVLVVEGRPILIILHFLKAFNETFVPFKNLHPQLHVLTINPFKKFKTLSRGIL